MKYYEINITEWRTWSPSKNLRYKFYLREDEHYKKAAAVISIVDDKIIGCEIYIPVNIHLNEYKRIEIPVEQNLEIIKLKADIRLSEIGYLFDRIGV